MKFGQVRYLGRDVYGTTIGRAYITEHATWI